MSKALFSMVLACTIALSASCGGKKGGEDEKSAASAQSQDKTAAKMTEKSSANNKTAKDPHAGHNHEKMAEPATTASNQGTTTMKEKVPTAMDIDPATLPGAPVDPNSKVVTPSGLIIYAIKDVKRGPRPTKTSTVNVHYTGWTLSDSKKFDSSHDRGEPAKFPLNAVIAGWTEGLTYIPLGSTYKLIIPPNLAYGENTQHGQPAGTLVFDIELLSMSG